MKITQAYIKKRELEIDTERKTKVYFNRDIKTKNMKMTEVSVQKLRRGKGNTDKGFPPHSFPRLRAAGFMLQTVGLPHTVICHGKAATG